MISKYIDLIIAPFLKKALTWIQEHTWRMFLSIVLLIVLLAFGIMFSKWLTFSKLFKMASKLFSITLLLSLKYYIYLLWANIIIVFGVIIYLAKKERKSRIIEVKIDRNSKPEDFFAIPPGSDWSLIPDDDVLGNVLSVSNSGLTGHLIKGAEWRNYRLTFKAKIVNGNFTFAIRVVDKNNCIFFQCGDSNIFPHLIIDGIAIRHFKDMVMPLKIPTEKWVSVSALVQSNNVIINIDGIKREFNIPKGPWFIEKKNLKVVLEYNDVEKASKIALNAKNVVGDIQQDQTIDEVIRELSANLVNIKLEDYYVFNFDFDRGTIGFRESLPEHALFKDIKVELLDKI